MVLMVGLMRGDAAHLFSRILGTAPLFASVQVPGGPSEMGGRKCRIHGEYSRTTGPLAKSENLTSFATNNISSPVVFWENNVEVMMFKTGFIKENTNGEDLAVFPAMLALRQRPSIFIEMPQNPDS